MKNNFVKRLISSLMVICLLMTSSVFVQAQSNEANLSFLALSDLHLDDLLYQTSTSNMEQFEMVLDASKDMDLDLFVGGGDYSSYGNQAYWYKARTMVNQAGFDNSIWALGNHEYGTLGLRTLARNKFQNFNGESKPYYVKEVNGYYFIVLGAETGILGTYGRLSSAAKSWFTKTIKTVASKSKGKPIFVVSHFDLDTGSMRKDFAKTMAKYQNVIFLWGHMHDDEYADMTYEQIFDTSEGFTAVRMGSVHYYDNDNADGLIVKVYDDHVDLQMKRVSGTVLKEDTLTVELKNE